MIVREGAPFDIGYGQGQAGDDHADQGIAREIHALGEEAPGDGTGEAGHAGAGTTQVLEEGRARPVAHGAPLTQDLPVRSP